MATTLPFDIVQKNDAALKRTNKINEDKQHSGDESSLMTGEWWMVKHTSAMYENNNIRWQ